jgi:hypothetical protein
MALLFLRKAFIARPDVATESARRVTDDQAREALDRHREALFGEGVLDLRVEHEKNGGIILVVVDSEAAAKALRESWGREIDGIPLRVVVE